MDLVTCVCGWGWDQAFNGELTTNGSNGNVAMPVENTGGASWTGNINTSDKQVYLYVLWNQSNADGQEIKINGTKVTLEASGGGSLTIQKVDITNLAGDAITSMQIDRAIGSNGAVGIAGIEVGDSLVVDEGLWNTDQIWSQGAETSGTTVGGAP